MEDRLAAIESEARGAIAGAADSAALEGIRLAYLGKKGALTEALRGMGGLSAEERPVFGKRVNDLKALLESALSEKGAALKRAEKAQRLAQERIDVTLPGRRPEVGRRHPLTIVQDQIAAVFLTMGYSVAEGPEVESDEYNFEKLNLPKEHSAREMWDTLYITPEILLRTHTSPVQARTMERLAPQPVRIICPGRVYRRDALDATHSPIFHQVEGLVVDKGIHSGRTEFDSTGTSRR